MDHLIKGKLPAVTPARLVLATLAIWIVSVALWLYTANAKVIPAWVMHSRLPEWLLRNWPIVFVVPVYLLSTLYMILNGWMSTPPGSRPIRPKQYRFAPEMPTKELFKEEDAAAERRPH